MTALNEARPGKQRQRAWLRARSKVCLGLIGTAAASILAGGLVAVADSAGGPMLYACVRNNNGAMRAVSAGDSCGAQETKISWNQQGPVGPPGGPGPAGPAGPAGVSDAYPSANGGSTPAFGASGLDVASVAVPPGTYVLLGNTELFNFTPAITNSGGCLLTDSNHVLSLGGASVDLGTGEAGVVASQGTATLNAPTTLVMHCNGDGMFASGSNLIAMKVGALH